MYARDIPENYTPASPVMGACGIPPMAQRGPRRMMREFRQNPSGLGMNNIEMMMDMLYAIKHNENGKGVEIERVGDESEMKKLLDGLGINAG